MFSVLQKKFTVEELKNIVNRSIVAKFRISAHRLRIETGRHERIRNSQGNLAMLDRGERKCLHCTLNEVEDESHVIQMPNINRSIYNIFQFKVFICGKSSFKLEISG
jgi:hypothetical protein